MSGTGTDRYRFWGLTVDSAIPLPEWSGLEHPGGDGEPDVTVSLSPGPGDAPPPSSCTVEAEGDTVVLGFPSAGWYRVRAGSRIEVTPAPHAGRREVRLFLLGSAWATLCYQRGLLPLHASLVSTRGGALALCGPSGAGKSTLAASLSRLGHTVVGDDLCRALVGGDGQPLVWPGTPRLKLWNEALEALRWDRDGLERDHFRLEKFHVPLAAAGAREPVPLQAVCLLEWGEEGLARLSGKDALRRFVSAATYRGDLLASAGRVETHWARCLDLVGRVPVYRLSRPRDLGEGDRIARRLSAFAETA